MAVGYSMVVPRFQNRIVMPDANAGFSATSPPIEDEATLRARAAVNLLPHWRRELMRLEAFVDKMDRDRRVPELQVNAVRETLKVAYNRLYAVDRLARSAWEAARERGWVSGEPPEDQSTPEGLAGLRWRSVIALGFSLVVAVIGAAVAAPLVTAAGLFVAVAVGLIETVNQLAILYYGRDPERPSEPAPPAGPSNPSGSPPLGEAFGGGAGVVLVLGMVAAAVWWFSSSRRGG